MIEPRKTTLLVDIGNGRAKWGLEKQNRVEPGPAFATQQILSRETLSSLWAYLPTPTSIMVSNVAGPDIAHGLKAWAEKHWGLPPIFVRSEAQGFGVCNAYLNPEKLGVDRWVALIAAHHGCSGPVCIADGGTAITVDALDAEGMHLGGVIAPGLALMRRSLEGGTCDLPLAQSESHERLARETHAGIASGTLQAAAGLIERCYRETANRVNSQPRLILTGGDAEVLASVLDIPCSVRPDLVLEGLLIIADQWATKPQG